MQMTLSSSTCITSPEGPESTDIICEAQQESASILNVLRAPMPADIRMSVPMLLIIHVLTLTVYVLWQIAEAFWV